MTVNGPFSGVGTTRSSDTRLPDHAPQQSELPEVVGFVPSQKADSAADRAAAVRQVSSQRLLLRRLGQRLPSEYHMGVGRMAGRNQHRGVDMVRDSRG